MAKKDTINLQNDQTLENTNTIFGDGTQYIRSDSTRNIFKTRVKAYKNNKNDVMIRTDRFVTWGYFEDNILSKYCSLITAKKELVSLFRSIEPAFDEKGDVVKDSGGRVIKKSVLIRNNPLYLQPKDIFAFFLPGQNVSFDVVQTSNLEESSYLFFWKKYVGYELDGDGKEFMKAFLRIRGDKESEKFSTLDGSYGRLRNVMINVREIQKAFGIDGNSIVTKPGSGRIYGSDIVDPPASLNAAVMNLLDSLNDNFHNFWKFRIVEDNFSKNTKIIEENSTAGLQSKVYTKFKENSHLVNLDGGGSAGIYKFPSYSLGSIVKSQDLSFNIPDSMAITSIYGANKNSTGGLVLDTSNDEFEFETLFNMDKNAKKEKDEKLAGLEKAYRTKPDGHSIGNKSANPNEPITMENGLFINPNLGGWNKWSTNRSSTSTEPQDGGTRPDISDKERNLLNDFQKEIQFVMSGYEKANEDIKKANAEIRAQIEALERQQQPPLEKGSEAALEGTEDDMSSDSDVDWSRQRQNQIDALEQQLISNDKLTNKYYQIIDDENTSDKFTMKLFDAGEAVVRTKLFMLDRKSSAYMQSFLVKVDLSLTVDGIAGITPGDIIQTDYIQPKFNRDVISEDGVNLGPHTFFQVFGHTQNVSSDGWFTELSTKMRMNENVLKEEAGEYKIIPVVKSTPPKMPRPPVPSEEEDIEGDLPLDPLDFDDFSRMDGPPPPPTPTATNLSEVRVIFGCMDDSPPRPGTVGHPDIYGKNRLGKPWKGDDFETNETGYLAQNYDPNAQINGVSEVDLSNPCLYDDFTPEDVPTFDFDISDPAFDLPEPKILYGCTDPNAMNYIGRGFENEISIGEVVIIQSEDSPCAYQNIPSDDEDIEDDLELEKIEFDDFSEMDAPPPPPEIKPIEPIKILDTKKVPEQERLKKKPKKKSIAKKVLEKPEVTEQSQLAQEAAGVPKDPPVIEGITRGACTDEQIALGYQTVPGYISGVDDGLNVNNPQMYGKFIPRPGGLDQSFVSLFCDARDPKPPKPKIEEKPKTPTILTPPKPTLLKSTYYGGYQQNALILYILTPWGNFGKKTTDFYGEGRTRNVDYFVRLKFWDENIEEPNETGISRFNKSLEFAGLKYGGKDSESYNEMDIEEINNFLNSWTGPKYTLLGKYQEGTGTGVDIFVPGYRWTPQTSIACARKPFNNIKGAPNPPTKLSGRGHSYSSDLSKQGSKIILGDN